MKAKQLFDTGGNREPSMKEVVRARNWGRKHFGTCEDKWEAGELVEVRKQLPSEFHSFDLFKLKNLMILSRKNKLDTKPKDPIALVTVVKRAANAHSKDVVRRPRDHSDKYETRIESTAWAEFASDHRKRCNYRCQLCGRRCTDGHHTPEGNKHLGEELDIHILSLCRRCHDVADLLRESETKKPSERLLLDQEAMAEMFGIEVEESNGQSE